MLLAGAQHRRAGHARCLGNAATPEAGFGGLSDALPARRLLGAHVRIVCPYENLEDPVLLTLTLTLLLDGTHCSIRSINAVLCRPIPSDVSQNTPLRILAPSMTTVLRWRPTRRRCRNLSGPSEQVLAVQKCSKCRRAQYCSPECQRAHWAAHKKACNRATAA